MTPGRALYEYEKPDVPWEELSADDRQWWEDRFSAGLAVLDPELYGRLYRDRRELRETLGRVRGLARSWAVKAPADRTFAECAAMPPYDTVSADRGREILAAVGELR